jgi:hypothetical protein
VQLEQEEGGVRRKVWKEEEEEEERGGRRRRGKLQAAQGHSVPYFRVCLPLVHIAMHRDTSEHRNRTE